MIILSCLPIQGRLEHEAVARDRVFEGGAGLVAELLEVEEGGFDGGYEVVGGCDLFVAAGEGGVGVIYCVGGVGVGEWVGDLEG